MPTDSATGSNGIKVALGVLIGHDDYLGHILIAIGLGDVLAQGSKLASEVPQLGNAHGCIAKAQNQMVDKRLFDPGDIRGGQWHDRIYSQNFRSERFPDPSDFDHD